MDEDNLIDLIDSGLNPEERAKLDQWEDGLMGEFWLSQVTPFLLSQKKACESYIMSTSDEAEWKRTQGKLALLRSLLGLKDYVRTQYAQVATERLAEMEESFNDNDEHDDYV
tara:strand:- start:284 stop:619 length:336 start_codon:yes stop_codon:yes gene_type:complete